MQAERETHQTGEPEAPPKPTVCCGEQRGRMKDETSPYCADASAAYRVLAQWTNLAPGEGLFVGWLFNVPATC